MNEPLVRIEGLSKRFRERGPGASRHGGFTAVRNVSFSIPAGCIFGLVGESGCGKTTLARVLLHLDTPTEGRVLFDDTDPASLSRRRLRRFRRRMQIVFQDPNGAMNPKLRVRTSLGEGLSNLGWDRAEIDRRIEKAVSAVGIPVTHLDRRPGEFSGGQKQRLVIARALTMEPEFLCLDEPVSNLDVSVQAQIINLLVDLRKALGLTYLFISHDLNLVSYLSDYVGVMSRGRIVEIGTAEEIINTPLHAYTRTLFASAARIVDHDDDEGISDQGATDPAEAPFRWIGPMRGVAKPRE